MEIVSQATIAAGLLAMIVSAIIWILSNGPPSHCHPILFVTAQVNARVGRAFYFSKSCNMPRNFHEKWGNYTRFRFFK